MVKNVPGYEGTDEEDSAKAEKPARGRAGQRGRRSPPGTRMPTPPGRGSRDGVFLRNRGGNKNLPAPLPSAAVVWRAKPSRRWRVARTLHEEERASMDKKENSSSPPKSSCLVDHYSAGIEAHDEITGASLRGPRFGGTSWGTRWRRRREGGAVSQNESHQRSVRSSPRQRSSGATRLRPIGTVGRARGRGRAGARVSLHHYQTP